MSKALSRCGKALFVLLSVWLLAASSAIAQPVAKPVAKHAAKPAVRHAVVRHAAGHAVVRHAAGHAVVRHAVVRHAGHAVAQHVAVRHAVHMAAKHAAAHKAAARHVAVHRAAVRHVAAHKIAVRHQRAVHHERVALHEQHVRAHHHWLIVIRERHHHWAHHEHEVVYAPAPISHEWAVVRRSAWVRRAPKPWAHAVARVWRGERVHVIGRARGPHGTLYYRVALRDGRVGWLNHVCIKFVR